MFRSFASTRPEASGSLDSASGTYRRCPHSWTLIPEQVDEKELKMRYNIDDHDYNVRLKAARKFLGSGDRVKVLCQFRGREADFQDIAFEMFAKFASECEDVGVINTAAARQGRQMIMVLAPKVSKAQTAALKEQVRKNVLSPLDTELGCSPVNAEV
jgi:hypothetical protein